MRGFFRQEKPQEKGRKHRRKEKRRAAARRLKIQGGSCLRSPYAEGVPGYVF